MIKLDISKVTHVKITPRQELGYEWVDLIYEPDWLDRLFGAKEEDISAYFKGGQAGSYNFKYSKAEVENDWSVEDIAGKLYTKPSCKIYIGSEHIRTKYTKTKEEAEDYAKLNFPHLNMVL